MKRITLLYVIAVLFVASHLTFLGKCEAATYHKVKGGECLSVIGQKLKMDWRKIAKANKIVRPYIIYAGQKLKISNEQKTKTEVGLYRPWTNHGSAPFHRPAGGILPKAKAIKGVRSFKRLPKEVKELFIKEIESKNFTWAVMKIADKVEEMVFKNGIADKMVVAKKQEAARRYTVVYEGKTFFLDEPLICHNLAWSVIQTSKQVAVVVGPKLVIQPPPKPPKPPELYNKVLGQFLEVLYQETECPDCQVDLSAGGSWQDYSDGAQDYTDWIYAAVRCHIWTDKYGNKHKPGLYINGNRWEGDWKKRFDFDGDIKTYGIEHRVETPNGQEFIFRLGYQVRDERGLSSDGIGIYRTDYKYNAIVFEAEVDDTARINEQWFPRMKAGIGLVSALSSERRSTWTNSSNGQVVNLNESPDVISGFQLKSEVDIFRTSNDIFTASAEFWTNFLFDGDTVAKITPYLGFFGDSLKIGYQFTGRNTNDSHARGNGPAWQIHVYDLFRYTKNEGWKRNSKKGNGIFSDPNQALSRKYSVESTPINDKKQGNNPFADPNGALLGSRNSSEDTSVSEEITPLTKNIKQPTEVVNNSIFANLKSKIVKFSGFSTENTFASLDNNNNFVH